MDPVLFVRQAAQFQSMELDRVEDVRGLGSSPWPRLRSSRGDCASGVRCGRQCLVTARTRMAATISEIDAPLHGLSSMF
jgi:hypothetical protein